MDEALLKRADEILKSMQILRAAGAGKAALMAFDTLLCLDREIEYIWKSTWSFTKCTYLTIRYLSLLSAFLYVYATTLLEPTPSCAIIDQSSSCDAAQYTVWAVTCVIMLATTAILAGRTWAMYQRKMIVLYFLIGMYSVAFGPAVAVSAITVRRHYQNNSDPERTAVLKLLPYLCTMGHLPPRTNAMLISGLCYETLLFVTIAWKVLQLRRGPSAIVGFLYHEGILYYLVIAAALLSAVIMSELGPIERAIVDSGYMIGLRSLMAARMILTLKGFLATISMSPPLTSTTMPTNPGDFNHNGILYSRADPRDQQAQNEWIDIAWRAESPEARPIDPIRARRGSLVEEYEMTPRTETYGSPPGMEGADNDYSRLERLPWADSPGTSSSMLSPTDRAGRSGWRGSGSSRSWAQ
ncbi:hypothetical protein FRC03_000657 [Tulasnella sp. 419]|nr:hypothetical protein FRC03_000657 [Tulasnella sp. 419]